MVSECNHAETSMVPVTSNDSSFDAGVPVPNTALPFADQALLRLEHQIDLYTLGESSSVAEEIAFDLLEGIMYAAGIRIGDAPVFPEGENDLADMHERGIARLEGKSREVERLWHEAVLSTPLFDNESLRETLEGLRDFKRRYDARFFPQKLPEPIEYRTSRHPSPKTRGADEAYEFLGSLLLENAFIASFDESCCRRVLGQHGPDWGEAPLNHFEVIAEQALLCAISGGDIATLALKTSPTDIRQELRKAGQSVAQACLSEAAIFVCQTLGIEDTAVSDYVMHFARTVG